MRARLGLPCQSLVPQAGQLLIGDLPRVYAWPQPLHRKMSWWHLGQSLWYSAERQHGDSPTVAAPDVVTLAPHQLQWVALSTSAVWHVRQYFMDDLPIARPSLVNPRVTTLSARAAVARRELSSRRPMCPGQRDSGRCPDYPP